MARPTAVRRPRRKRSVRTAGLVAVLFLLPVIGTLAHVTGGTNPVTPAGHEGYLFHQPLMVGQRENVGVQAGPTSPGWRWRQYVINIDMRATTYSEQMHIFSSDNLEVSFEAHARVRLRADTVNDIVQTYSGPDWYVNNVRRPYRTAVREVVRQHEAFQIKDESEAIAETILARLREEYADTPFEFLSMSIGNIDFPESVEQRVVANLAAEQRRQRMEVQERIAQASAEIQEIRARGEAEAQQIQQETLTPLYVQHEAADLYRSLADDTDDDDGVARARVVLVVPTRPDRAGVPHIYAGEGR
ncbi:MAG: SPFH domain-containing protein [Sandaracinaceae bacterium]